MKYRIEMTAEAVAELHDAYLWIRNDSPNHAVRWRLRILEAMQTLANMPERCEIAPESEHFHQEIRQLLFGKKSGVYRILFTIDRDVIYILHIRHSARRFFGEAYDVEEGENTADQ
jgi:plasmid stabilization system protein ParE